MRSSAIVALFVTAAAAQGVQNYTSSLNMTIDPNTVPIETRAQWCQGERDTCTTLCNKNADENNCSQDDLSYECTCASNNSAPGLQYYQSTMPTYICNELFGQCNTQYVGDAENQKLCMSNIHDLCGTVPPKASKSEEDSSSSTTTQAPTASKTSPSSSDKTMSSSTSDGFAAPTMAPGAAAAALGLLAYLI